MDHNTWLLYEDLKEWDDTLAVLVVEKESAPLTITDGIDTIILVITSQAGKGWIVRHYNLYDNKVSIHYLTVELMNETLITSNNRRLINWLINGEVKFDRDSFLQQLKERMDVFPSEDRAKKMTIQFTKLLRRFEEGRAMLENKQYYDAFSNMMHALHHLARLAVINQGYYPEVTVWKQVKEIEPQTYKLYQELLNSEETLEKRIQLLILATEFAIQSKTEIGSKHFLELLGGEWYSISDLMNIPEVADYRVDLELLVYHLVEKELLQNEVQPLTEHIDSHLYRRSPSLKVNEK